MGHLNEWMIWLWPKKILIFSMSLAKHVIIFSQKKPLKIILNKLFNKNTKF